MPRLLPTTRENVLTCIAFVAILVVYLLFPTKNYYWDGIFFARTIEAAPQLTPSLLHPNHLLYNVFGYGVYSLVHAVGLNSRAIDVLQITNSVVSVGAAILLYLMLRRVSRSRYVVWSLTLMFAFSATWWKFSTDADSYILSVFFLLLTFLLTWPEQKPRPWLSAVVFSAAALVHELAVLTYPVFALAIYWQSSTNLRRQQISSVLQFCLTSFLLILGIYYGCFYLASGSTGVTRFFRWVTSASPDASFSFNVLSNLGYSLRSNIRMIISARPSLLRDLINPAIWILLILLFAATVSWLIAMVRGIRHTKLKKLQEAFRSRVVKLCLLWIGVYLVFLFFWLPHNTFYRLFYWPPLIVLLAALIKPPEKSSYRPGLFVIAMTLANFLFFIYPYSKAEKYPPLSLALEMNNVWQPGTVVYFQSENSDNNLTAYINPSIEWRSTRDLSQLEAELKNVHESGKSTWLDASAIDHVTSMPGGREWLTQHAKQETWRQRSARGYNVKFVQVVP